MSRNLALSVIAGIAVAQLGWIDPIFIPLALAGPLATGALAATRGIALRWAALTWFVAGIAMLVGDEIVNHEDAIFHAVLAVVMAGLASAGWAITTRLTRGRAVPV
ncbi:MAG: hypothetical protein ACJ76I_16060 [Gaiellaceae bacterium]